MQFKHVAGIIVLLLVACGGTGGSGQVGDSAALPTGTALVTITASPSSFLSYRVKLVSVRLLSADGTRSIETLPLATDVDLAQLAQIEELLAVVQTAPGRFTTLAVTLDYASAAIIADDGTMTGVALAPTAGQVHLTLALDPEAPLEVVGHGAARVALDIDLLASNDIDLTRKTVTVAPLVSASLHATDLKPIRVRGPLLSADLAHANFTMQVRPFNAHASESAPLHVSVSDITTYEVNGTPHLGAAGLAQLVGRGGAMSVAYGTLNFADTSFDATRVYAGSSVEGSGFDRLTGTVVARSRNSINLIGASLVTNDGASYFVRGEVPVMLGNDTAVTLAGQGARSRPGLAQISVGSQILAFGKAAGAGPDSAPGSAVSLDATAGRVRVVQSQVAGMVTARLPGGLAVSLVSVGGHSARFFDFTGTGTSPATDAVGSRYRLGSAGDGVGDGAGLESANAPLGGPVVASGIVNAYGAAPPDFLAVSTKDSSTLTAQLVIDWGAAGSAKPFESSGPTEISLDVAGAVRAGRRHSVEIGPQAVDLSQSALRTLIVPDTAAPERVFAIAHRDSAVTESFDTVTAFLHRLTAALDGGTRVRCLTASGQYAARVNTLTANRIAVCMNDQRGATDQRAATDQPGANHHRADD